MNIWDILIILLVGAAVLAALRIMRGHRETGACACGCEGCTKKCSVRQEENTDKTNR